MRGKDGEIKKNSTVAVDPKGGRIVFVTPLQRQTIVGGFVVFEVNKTLRRTAALGRFFALRSGTFLEMPKTWASFPVKVEYQGAKHNQPDEKRPADVVIFTFLCDCP